VAEGSFLRRAVATMAMSGGLIVLGATLVNELLMGISGRGPIWWAVPYFPLRTVAIPFAAIVQVLVSLRMLWVGPSGRHRMIAVAGIAVSVVVVWFSWFFGHMLFFTFPQP
jgi:hypothetical protein